MFDLQLRLPHDSSYRARRADNEDAVYSSEETEFMLAMQRFKEEKHRPFPTWSEVLAVFRSLGWKRQL